MIGKIFILGLVSAFVVGSGGCSKAPETNTAKPAPASLPDTNAPEVLLAQRQELVFDRGQDTYEARALAGARVHHRRVG